MKKTIFISTGEVSGDLHGSFLSRKLFELNPELNIVGFGSLEMEKAGVHILKDVAAYSGVGLIENIPAAFQASKSYKLAKTYFSENKVDIVVLIDNQGFNLKLADLAKKHKIKVVYYIGPQEWIWGFKNGKQKIISKVDKLFAVFKKEYDFYAESTDKVQYVGNPLLDMIKVTDKNKVREELGIKSKKIIGLMPGSRKQEINSLLPIFIETSLKINQEHQIDFIIISSPLWIKYIRENFDLKDIKLLEGNSINYMQVCDLIIAASGTVTLEAAILDIPIISNYKLTKLSYTIAKMLIKLDYFSLPNIIAGKKVIPEFIQENVSTENLISTSLNILYNPETHNEIIDGYKAVRELLKPEDAITTTAKSIIEMITTS